MKSRIKRKLNPASEFAITSYSQEGEDIVLRRFLDEATPGFYVDVGCHHPYRFSNTYYYYRRGWCGINIDADPSLIDEFNKRRPRDINLAVGVGTKDHLTFYVFNERAINTFDAKLAKERSKINGYKIIEEKTIEVIPLREILERHLPKDQSIDFMSVDVEGKDLEVIKSNDWKKFRPKFILVECLDIPSLKKIGSSQMAKFLADKGYAPIAKTLFTVIFEDEGLR